MSSFEREISGMRRVRHVHCVKLEASFTDTDWVRLLCCPVADMNLSELLDQHAEFPEEKSFLRRAIGCITSALAYLHELEIRYAGSLTYYGHYLQRADMVT